MLVFFALAQLLTTVSLCAPSAEEVTKEKMLAASQWQEKYQNCVPSPDLLAAVRTKLDKVTFVVYLGLWCSDSRNNVPQFLKILDALETPIPARYLSVPRKPNSDVKFYDEDLKVERVPTFIVYRNGTEIGRIIENPKTGMLEDLADIVLAAGPQ
jgi:hypothetical protein